MSLLYYSRLTYRRCALFHHVGALLLPFLARDGVAALLADRGRTRAVQLLQFGALYVRVRPAGFVRCGVAVHADGLARTQGRWVWPAFDDSGRLLLALISVCARVRCALWAQNEGAVVRASASAVQPDWEILARGRHRRIHGRHRAVAWLR